MKELIINFNKKDLFGHNVLNVSSETPDSLLTLDMASVFWNVTAPGTILVGPLSVE